MPKVSFDSERSNGYSDCEIEEIKTKEENKINEKEGETDDEIKEYENAELISAISQTLETILEDNKHRPNYKDILRKQSNMIFSAQKVPSISIEDYLKRIQKYSNMEKNTLITSLIFIDRLCKISNLTLTYYNIHRILFTSVLISIKYNEDSFFDNQYYSEIGGVKLKELKMLEYNFVEMVHFRFFVDEELFETYRQHLDNFE